MCKSESLYLLFSESSRIILALRTVKSNSLKLRHLEINFGFLVLTKEQFFITKTYFLKG